MISCTFEKGFSANLRHVTVGAIAVKNNQILLVKRAKNLSNGDKYAIPGGFLNRDENTSQAVLRELKEETGYDGKIDRLFFINDSPFRPQEDRQNVDFIFIVNIGEKVSGSDSEVQKVEWFNLGELPSKDQFAFDHFEDIELYINYLKNPQNLPIFNLF